MAAEYVVTDRTTATKYAIAISDGQLNWDTTANAASAEPIFNDVTNPSDYWKLFIDDNQLGWESTVTVQDDSVLLDDTVTSNTYQLKFGDGQLYWEIYTDSTSRPQHVVIVQRRFRDVVVSRRYRVIK